MDTCCLITKRSSMVIESDFASTGTRLHKSPSLRIACRSSGVNLWHVERRQYQRLK